MKIESIKVVAEFYETIKKDYPELSFDQVKDICYGPWRYLKTVMERGDLEEMRIKFFGTFLVHPKKAKFELENVKKGYLKKNIPDKEYFRIKAMIEKFLNRQDNE